MAANDGMNVSGNANQNGERPIQLAQANVPNIASSGSGANVIHVTPPAPGAREDITVLPGQTVVLDGVDLATARVERVEGGVLITLADGGVIFLAGFADAAGSANPPHIEIPGLGAIEASQLLAAADANVSNIQPAAGPGAGGAGGVAHGGGANFSDVNPGSIGDGLNRLPLGPSADFNRTPPEPQFALADVNPTAETIPAAAVQFGITATPGSVREEFGWGGVGSEGGPVDVGHFTVNMTGTLSTGQHASVVLNVGGSASQGVDYGSTTSPSANMDTVIGNAVGGTHVGNVWTNAATGLSYDASTHTLTFTGGGATSLTFNMVPVDDSIVEGTENASVTLSNAASPDGVATVGAASSASVNITETDHVVFNITAVNPEVSEQFAAIVNGNTVVEGDTAHYIVSYDGTLAVGQTASVQVHTADGTAVHPADFGNLGAGVSYNAATGVLTFTGGGATSVEFTVPTVDDSITEGTENFTVNLSNPSANGVIGTGTATTDIIDNDHITFNLTGDASVAEGTTAHYTLSYDGELAPGQTATVQIATADGTAVNPADFGDLASGVSYDPATHTVTFTGGGATSVEFTVGTVDDSISEGTENFSVNLSAPSGNADIGTGTVNTDITDNDAQTITLTGTTTVTEGDTAHYTVALGATGLGAGQTITFTVDAVSGTATEGADFGGLNGTFGPGLSGTAVPGPDDSYVLTLTNTSGSDLAPGSVLTTFNVPTVADGIYESSEDFTAVVTSTATVTGSPVDTTIIDNDAQPSFSVNDVTVNEADGTITFTVTKTGLTALPSAVDYSVAPNTAVTPDDYAAGTSPLTGTLFFDAGDTTKTITLSITDDNVFENTETFFVNLGASVNATVSDAQGVGTILDNDAKPAFSINDVTVNEGDGTITFTITKTGATALGSTVDYTVNPGTATTPADYGAGTSGLTGTVSFAAGETAKTITLSVVDDNIFEGPENFTVDLSNATNATIADNQGVGTIIDNDAAALQLTGSTSVVEGNTASYTVSLVGAGLGAGQSVTMTLDSASGTATEVADFAKLVQASIAAGTGIALSNFSVGANGEVTFTATNTSGSTIAAGSALATVSLPTVDDTTYEGNENFTVSLTSAGTVTGSPVTTTITDNDSPPSFTINDVTVNESAGTITFTVTKTGTTALSSSVDYAVAPNTATTPSDYTAGTSALTGTLNFAAGDTTKTITLNIVNDAVFENTETFFVNLSNPSNATIADAQGIGTIIDNDSAVHFAITGTPASVSEEASGTGHFTVNMTGTLLSGQTATVVVTPSGSATDGTDYTAMNTAIATAIAALPGGSGVSYNAGTHTLSFTGGGATSLTFDVSAINDNLVEGTETATFTLSAPTVTSGSADITTPAASVNITEIDSAVHFAITETPASISEDTQGTAHFTINLTGTLFAGNTASVVVTPSGSATDGTDYTALDTAIANAIAALPGGSGVSYNSSTNTLTFTGGGATSLNFDVSAINDQTVEGTETATMTLSSATVTNGTADITTPAASVNITEIDSAVHFAITGTPASISEETQGTAHFTVALTGTLIAGNTASIVITPSGSATDGTDYTALDTAIANAIAALPGGSGVSYNSTTNTLTFTGGGATSLTFNPSAINDQLVEGTETATFTLSGPTVTNGTADIITPAASVNITEIDSAVTFGVTVTSNGTTNDASTQSALISEGSASDGHGTYTITLGGTLAAGNTASVTLGFSGTATDGTDYSPAIETAIANAIAALPGGSGVSYNATTNVLTFTGGGATSLSFGIDALNDAINEVDETAIVTLTAPSVTNGTATLDAGHTVGTISISDTTPNILDGTLTTNSNSSSQLITLTFAEVQTGTDTNWHHAASKIYDLSAQGQQGSVLQDVGFNISTSNQYEVALEATSGTKAIISALTLEMEAIKPAGGNEQLQLDNTSATNSTETAFTSVITPSHSVDQPLTVSQDGSGAGETINDNKAGFSYIYGADGNDTLTANTNQPTLFNGGNGADSITGGSGNDIIVYDALDTVNGGGGVDLLRIDQGAIYWTQHGSGTNTGTLDPANNQVIDLTVRNATTNNISNIEGILITEEAGQDNLASNPNDAIGTVVKLDAASVLAYTDSNHTLAVLGSKGDQVTIKNFNSDGWALTSTHTDAQNQTMDTYTTTVNNVTVSLVVDHQVQVNHG